MLKRVEVVAGDFYLVKSSTVRIPLVDCKCPEFFAVSETPFVTL